MADISLEIPRRLNDPPRMFWWDLGAVGETFIPSDTPLQPTRVPAQLLGWPAGTLREEYWQNSSALEADAVRGQSTNNDAAVRGRQTEHGVQSSQRVGDDVTAPVLRHAESATGTIDNRRDALAGDQGQLSEDYNATVGGGKISPHHGGNRAVWDTVGAQTDNRAKLGTAPETPTIGEWHLNKDGVPVRGPEQK